MKPYRKTCVVCGRTFLSEGRGAKLKKTCSKACADRRSLKRVGRDHRGVKFTKLITQGVCLGCGGTTRKGRATAAGQDGQPPLASTLLPPVEGPPSSGQPEAHHAPSGVCKLAQGLGEEGKGVSALLQVLKP